MVKENLGSQVVEENYGNGYSLRLLDSRNSLTQSLDKTPIWHINQRDGIQQTIDGIDRMLGHLAELDLQQDAQVTG